MSVQKLGSDGKGALCIVCILGILLCTCMADRHVRVYLLCMGAQQCFVLSVYLYMYMHLLYIDMYILYIQCSMSVTQ